jgi:hypothetical protein
MDGEIDSRRAAENQSIYRSVNERIKALNEVLEDVSFGSEWVCECADTECTVRVTATLHEYETVRLNPRAFIVYPEHVFPDVELIVAGNERFTVVEVTGGGIEIAEARDPRGTDR